MKNQIFDAGRFSAYFKKYIFEKRSTILICLGVFLLLPLLFCLGLPYIKGLYTPEPAHNFIVRGNVTDPMWYSELTLFSCMWIIACVFCCDFYTELSKKRERISIFTCPASNFEKFATSFIVFVIFFPIALILLFLFADAIRVWVYSASSEGISCIHYISPRYLLSFGCDMKYFDIDLYAGSVSPTDKAAMLNFYKTASAVKFSMCLFGGFLLQSLFALGSSVWPKKSGLKTACFLMTFGIVTSILFYWGINTFYGDNAEIEPRDFGISNEMTQVIIWDIVAICIIIFTWAVSYFRFKEWEIIKRW